MVSCSGDGVVVERSSRHKSSIHSSKEAKEYSDSNKDQKGKKESGGVSASKNSGDSKCKRKDGNFRVNVNLLPEEDDFYRIRLPSNVLNTPGKDFVISSTKARCLPRDALDEHFVIHTDGVNILAVNYGSPGACRYPRLSKLPMKWSFNSRTVLKNTEHAPSYPSAQTYVQ